MFGFFKKKKTDQGSADTKPLEHPLGRLVKKKNIADLEQELTNQVFQVPVSTSGAMDSCGSSVNLRVSLTSGNTPAIEYFANTSSFIGYVNCALLAQNPIIDRACSLKAQDGVRNWMKLATKNDIDANIQSIIDKADQKFDIKGNLIEADKFKNIFGIRHVLFKVDSPDSDYYTKPFNPDSVTPGSYKGMHQVSPLYLIPEFTSEGLSNPLSDEFMNPLYWVVSGVKIHRSHFVILYGSEVADFLKPTYRYGGVSLAQQMYERLYKAERTADEAPELALNKRTLVLKTNTAKIAAKPEVILATMESQNHARNNHGQMIIDTDDEMQQLDTSLSDFNDLIQVQYQIVSSLAKIPFIKLFQDSPSGLSQTGTFEIADYNESVNEVQENVFDPILLAHYTRLIRSEICPQFGIQPFDINIVWEPVDNPTSTERATTNNLNSQTDLVLQQAGAITSDDIREQLSQNEDSPYYGIDPFIPDDEREEPPIDLDFDKGNEDLDEEADIERTQGI